MAALRQIAELDLIELCATAYRQYQTLTPNQLNKISLQKSGYLLRIKYQSGYIRTPSLICLNFHLVESYADLNRWLRTENAESG